MAKEVFVHPKYISESEQVGEGTRIWAFAHVRRGAVVGRDCNIGGHAFIEGGAILGNGVTVKNGVCIWEGVTLDNFVFVGPAAVFMNDLHPRSPRDPVASSRYHDKIWLKRTRVNEGAAIGANATIVCGLTIGRYAMIGAGAVVLKDVSDFRLVVGNPARDAGWVCMCGERLRERKAIRCNHCGRTYTDTGSGLVAAH